jgi:NAD(P)-dependent dehydrogenase (short-subunit alcohol dehydrogenase family)
MNLRFDKVVALVAGGTGALGRAVALAFLDEGATVVVTYRAQAEYDSLVVQAGLHSARLQGVRADVTNEAAALELVQGVTTQHGSIDALVNAVGGYAGGAPMWSTESAALDKMLALNLRSGYALARAVVPLMLERHSGAIVNIAAKAGLEHPRGAAVYAASKAAALALMDSLAADLLGSGVRVNSVLPSIIDSPANRQSMPQADFASWPKPEEIAQVVLFLCAADSKLIHGASIPVYGSL